MIAVEAGAAFVRIDGRSFDAALENTSPNFDIYARSCICASSVALADELLSVADPVLARLAAREVRLCAHVCACVYMCACMCVYVCMHVHLKWLLHPFSDPY